ncbi:MAG TPA: cytochrome c1 [Nevskiaceae bacterium]|nr:cytochrome c1 [Nevskiaceae bacterium]
MRVLPLLAVLCALVLPGVSLAQEGAVESNFRASPGNTQSVSRGARDFVNYCAGCHTLKYLRYNQLGAALGISDATLEKTLIFPAKTKASSEMLNGMTAADGKAFFGKDPPDLSLEAQYRDPEWIYEYLHSFYLDPKRPTGVNNTLLPNVAMPDVVANLQGWQKRVKGADGKEGLELVSQGSMSPSQFDAFVGDLTNFLTFAATPEYHTRATIGPFVLLYLVILGILCYLVKREFWKDVHQH